LDGVFIHRPLLISALFVAAGAVALLLDSSVSQGWLYRPAQGLLAAFQNWMESSLGLCEVFGHGLGALVVLLLVYHLDAARRKAIPLLALTALAAGLLAAVVKMSVERIRPIYLHANDGIMQSFVGWFPLWKASFSHRSFPSGHTAIAVALAVSLSRLYPRGRLVFIALATAVGCQRVACGAHFLSDVCCGAAIGMLAVALLDRQWRTTVS
jgi:membrane-associated phospholipid phosphatase